MLFCVFSLSDLYLTSFPSRPTLPLPSAPIDFCRPVGPEGDSIGQKPEYRCNHFQWLNPPGNGTKKIN